jgi:Ca2+-binding EF-hand superfamily protein
MKTIRTTLLSAPVFLALALLAVPVSSRADEPPKEKPLSKAKEKFDADHDGKLNDEEKAAAKEASKAKAKATREANLAKYDANKNGKLDDDERAQKKADEESARDARKAEREAKKSAKEEANR